MGLFDDLLKKPTNPQSTGDTSGTSNPGQTGSGSNPPASDPLATVTPPPVIQKTEEISIMTESAQATAPSEPPPVTSHAIDDVSSILISSGSSGSPVVVTAEPTETPVIISTPSESLIGGISNVEVSAPTPTIQKTQEITDFGNLFGDDSDASIDAMTAPVTPVEESTSIDTQIAKAESILGLTEDIETPIIAAEGVTEESTLQEEDSIESIISNTETAEPVMESTTTAEGVTEDTSSLLGFTVDENSSVAAPETTYEHPADFIQASIEKIDAMVEKIETAHNAKLGEALNYKTEKEKYTALEESAYADAQKLIEEKDHALGMRAYFVEQGERESRKQESITTVESVVPTEATPTVSVTTEEVQPTETTGSVETALTGIAVQSAVTETVTPTKKAKKEESVEELGILGL